MILAELMAHLLAEHNAPQWVMLTNPEGLPHVHDLDHETRPTSGMPALTHDHTAPDLKAVPDEPEPRPWCWEKHWLPTGGFTACHRTKGHQGEHDFRYQGGDT